LKTACLELFGNRGATAAKVKALALATAASSKRDKVRAAETRAALDWLYGCLISENGAGNGKRLSQSEDLAMRELQRPLRSAIDAQTHAKARYVAQSPHRPENGQLAEQMRNLSQISVAIERPSATALCSTQALVRIGGVLCRANEGLRNKVGLAVFQPMR
jgi:hypothetical protein